MADSKITALTAITTVNPATYPLVIVDTSDTSMAGSGTTKKVTTNQLLGSGGTATLASATISGALTAAGNSVIGTGSDQNAAAGRGNLTIGGTSSAILNLSINSADTGYVIHDGTNISLVNRIAAGSLNFYTNSSTRYQIASDGVATWSNVGGVAGTAMTLNANGLGIGVTPSAWGGSYKALQLQSVARNIAATGAGSGDLTVAFNAIYDSTDSRWEYAGTGDKAGRYSQTGSGNHRWFVSNTAGTAGNEITDFASPAMTLDSGGNLLVGVTSANASGGVLQLKSGITFPATQVASSDANTLDDYEEGNWTPSITFGGASVGMTGTFAGRYTKVGRAVTINGIIALTAKGSSTGIARIAGLPFTSANASGEYTAISIRIDRVSFADYPCGYVGPNSSVVELENTTNAGTVSSMTDSNFINTSVVIVNFTYTV